MQADCPHLAMPFTKTNHHVVVVEQDSPEHVMSCELAIVMCPVGFRVERPEFGVPYPEYETEISDDVLASAIRQYEPRSAVHVSHILQAAEAIVTVEVETG